MSNGLILLLIVAIWSVYLLQHWVRRRENLATARSVDRFSEAMRVLERRGSTPIPVLASQAEELDRENRPGTPSVSVKQPRPTLRAGVTMKNSRTSTPRTASRTGQGANAPRPAVSVGNRVFRAAGSLTPARIKAGTLLVVAVAFVGALIATPFGMAPWWSPLVMLLALGGVVAWLRSSAIKARAERDGSSQDLLRPASPRRAPARPTRQQAATPRRATKQHAQPGPTATSAAPVEVPTEHLEHFAAPHPAQHTAAGDAVEVFDVAAVMVQEQETEQDAPAVDTVEQSEQVSSATAPDGWQPVTVPRPTYTMKARADRPEPAPAATTPAGDEVSVAKRYADTPVEDLPFDGMALDADLDDLPAVHRAG